ncbi:natural resistance-associated macrophage protein-domain-containing protein [Cladochytrium replicatum]|nr:natural resistance-associated macrophage protein-domain-containing protein [Cladochytrium replicatum]
MWRQDRATQSRQSGANQSTWKSWKTFFSTLAKFLGPGMLVAVGYMDPNEGNWSSDLAAGSEFGYKLLFVIFMSNVFAILLQFLCIKLGVVTGRDLAQSCAAHSHPWLNIVLYILCELAIIATDLAEVIGTAIGLNLLFHIPLSWGVVITAADVLIILFFWTSRSLRVFETIIAVLVLSIGVCFSILLSFSRPNWPEVGLGYLPKPELLTNPKMLYLGIAIIGATVMPHNLYLHSNLVRYRSGWHQQKLGEISELQNADDYPLLAKQDDTVDSIEDPAVRTKLRFWEKRSRSRPLKPQPLQPLTRRAFIPDTIKMSAIDSGVSLSLALLINSSILIVAGASFYNADSNGEESVITDLQAAYRALSQQLVPVAGTLFAVALLASGQSSTITGTLAGQIVMEGFFSGKIRIPPVFRRLLTRLLAIIPALTVVLIFGESGLNKLLVLSQVILSLQLPFAVWPLVYFTSSRRIMDVKFVDTPVIKAQNVTVVVEDGTEQQPPKSWAGRIYGHARMLPRQWSSVPRSSADKQSAMETHGERTHVSTEAVHTHAEDVEILPAEQAALAAESEENLNFGTNPSPSTAIEYQIRPSDDSEERQSPTDAIAELVVESYVNGWPLTVAAVLVALIITAFNVVLLVQFASSGFSLE